MRRFISFEGIDGAGKSSHIPWMKELLASHGLSVTVSREPGGTALGEKLRELLLSEPMDLTTEAMLMTAARHEHLVQVIEPALARGNVVLCDRFHDSTYAFQGGGRGLAKERLDSLHTFCSGLRPDLTFLFDVSPEIAEGRLASGREAKDRFERERQDFHRRVRDTYLARAQAEPGRIVVIDSSRPIEVIRAELAELTLTLIVN